MWICVGMCVRRCVRKKMWVPIRGLGASGLYPSPEWPPFTVAPVQSRGSPTGGAAGSANSGPCTRVRCAACASMVTAAQLTGWPLKR
jgi:hypothetical protein